MATTPRPVGWCYQCGRETSLERHSTSSVDHMRPYPRGLLAAACESGVLRRMDEAAAELGFDSWRFLAASLEWERKGQPAFGWPDLV